jgi:hypothetical protein
MIVEQQSKKMQADFALSGLFIKWCLDPNGLGARSIEDFEYAMGTETDAATIIEAAEVKDTILPQLELDRVNKMLWLPLFIEDITNGTPFIDYAEYLEERGMLGSSPQGPTMMESFSRGWRSAAAERHLL